MFIKFVFLWLLPLQLFSQQNSILFENVNVVDVVQGKVVTNQHVLVVGNRIKTISSKIIAAKGAAIINGTGKYLIPGLCDFNAQVLNYEHEGIPAFSLMLANGVTSVRDLLPDQSLPEISAIKRKISQNYTLAPRLYLSGKTLIDRVPFQEENIQRSFLVTSTAEAEKAIDSMLFFGADVIDIRTILDDAILKTIIRVCHEKGVKVVARYSGNWLAASDKGIDAFSHISDLWRAVSKGREGYFRFSEADSMRFVTVPDFYNRVLPSLGTVDTPYFYSLVDVFKKNDTWLCFSAASFKPSLVKFEIGDTSRAQFRTKKQMAQLAEFLKLNEQITSPQIKAQKPAISFVILAAKNGVPIVAGTQLEDFTTPGLSLHDMLYWLVDGGITPAEALRTATINPAIFLNKQKVIGTVEEGKLADLVLLDANPLDDINATRRVNVVIANGRLLKRKDLDKILEQAKQRVNNSK